MCPAVAALDGWDRAGQHSRGTQFLHHGELGLPIAARGMTKRGEGIAGKGCEAASLTRTK